MHYNKRKAPLWIWGVILGLIVGQGILIYALVERADSAISAIGWLTGALLPIFGFAISLLQKHSVWFYLRTQWLRSLISSSAPAWSLSANFTGKNITQDTLEEIVERVGSKRKATHTVAVRRINADVRQILLTPGPTVELEFNRSTASPISDAAQNQPAYIQASIRNYIVGYRQSTKAMRSIILPILEDIAAVIESVETRFTLTIEFGKERNPFFGLYLARLDPRIVTSFSIRLVIENKPNASVHVSENRISINAPTQSDLQILALEFLTFDSKIGEHISGNELFTI